MTNKPAIAHDVGYGIENLNPDEFAGRKLVRPAKRNTRVEKWQKSLERIETDVIDIATNRAAFRELNEVLAANREIPYSDILDYWAGNYGRSQAVAVRRQTDLGQQSITLGQLLVELQESRDIVTRERYVGGYEWGHQGRGDRDFDTYAYVDPDDPQPDETGDELSGRLIERDITTLKEAASEIRGYVDQVIAHADKRVPDYSPTFADLDVAIDAIIEMFRRYVTLLTGRGFGQVEATPQFDRLDPFRVPWIAD